MSAKLRRLRSSEVSALTDATQAVQRSASPRRLYPECRIRSSTAQASRADRSRCPPRRPASWQRTALHLIADDGVAESIVTVTIETAQGAELARTEAKFPADTKSGRFVFELPVATYRSAGKHLDAAEMPLLERSVDSRVSRRSCPTSRAPFLRRAGETRDLPAVARPADRSRYASPGHRRRWRYRGLEVTELSSPMQTPQPPMSLSRDARCAAMELSSSRTRSRATRSAGSGYARAGRLHRLSGRSCEAAARQAVIILPPPVPSRGWSSPFQDAREQAANEDCVKCSDVPPMDFDERQALQKPRSSATTRARPVPRSQTRNRSSASGRSSPYCGWTSPRSAARVR